MVYNNLSIYKEVAEMSKELRRSINNMPRPCRYVMGDVMRRLLIDIKYSIYLCNSTPGEGKLAEMEKLKDLIYKLEICINDCIEENSLHLKTKFSVLMPLKRLKEIKSQAAKWKSYAESKYLPPKINSASIETAKEITKIFSTNKQKNEKE